MKRPTFFIQHNPVLQSSLRASLIHVLIFIILPFQLKAAYSNHSTSIAEKIEGNWYCNESYTFNNLTEQSDDKFYFSGELSGKPLKDAPYIQVTLKDGGLEENNTDDLVFYIRRTQISNLYTINNAQPIVFGVMVLYYDQESLITSSQYVFNLSFLYRGPLTDEYSARIPVKSLFDRFPYVKGKKIAILRFFPLATNNDSFFASRSNKFRDIALKRFDVLKIRHNEAYSDTNRDELHLTSDYLTDIKDCEFINTRGVFDEPNRPSGWEEITDADENTLKSKGININFPDYKLLDSNTSTYPLASGQKRQPAHTVEHILYAMPGDVIPLYPYYDLPNPSINQFQENFSHWYDYKTGGRVYYDAPWNQKYDLLDFLNNPAKVQVTDNCGFFGGKGMNCSKEYKISSEQQYIDAVTEINNNKNYGDAYIELTSDIDFDNRSDIPMLGDYFPFKGTFNGNGHKISNLVYNFPDSIGVGLIGKTEGNVLIENINLDESCKFLGSYRVGGIVGLHNHGTLTIKNIHSEAWVYGVRQNNEQNAAGILGVCETLQPASINIEDCYIGGKIGNPATNIDHSFNAVVIGGWWATTGISTFKNIIVDCELTGRENLSYPNKVYIRHGQNTNPISIDANGVILKGNFRFENCYGNIDPSDECWKVMNNKLEIPLDGLTLLQNASWNTESLIPGMNNSDLSAGYTNIHRINSVEEYIQKVKLINEQHQNNVYIELLQDLDFSTTNEEVPIIYEGFSGTQYKLFINGRGHTISNLHISRTVSNTDNQNVGLVGIVGGDTRIENIIIDKSCSIEANKAATYNNYIYVGIVSRLFGGKFIAKNVKSEATIKNNASWGYTGGLLGFCGYEQNDNYLEFENIYIGGKISNKNCSALVGCLRTGDRKYAITKSTFKNIVVDCAISNPREKGNLYIGQDENTELVSNTKDSNNNKHFIKSLKNKHGISFTNDYQNCYGNLDSSDICWITYDYSLILPLIEEWTNETTPNVRTMFGHEKLRGNGDRLPGTMATFFCPRNPYDNSLSQSLPLNGEKEYVIAADFSQRFDPITQISLEGDEVTISEPAIAFRHIFRIRDGKAFADEISGSVTNNDNFVRRNQKRVSARSNVDFQIRLDFPHPVVSGSSSPQSNYYYKISDDEYGRVYDYDIIVFDENRTKLPGKQGFSFGAPFTNQGTRVIDDQNYYYFDAGNTNKYNRMLLCKNPKEGHYIVQIVGKDKSGIIKIFDSDLHQKTDHNLVLMEYNIIFLPPKGGTMLTEDELYSKDDEGNSIYETAQVEFLNEKFGGEKKEPTTYIDFDEYFKINQLTGADALKNKLIAYINYDNGHYTPSTPTPNGKESSYFKWPVPWNQSNYSFGYNIRQDYNMYMLATHSNCVPYMEAAKTWTKNMPGDYDGLYDRSYYASMRKYKMESQTRSASSEDVKQGYFYYVNAASDPGVTARLTINDLCQGSTIHVSAWMAEFSKDTEKANLSFNFVAVLADGYETAHPGSGLKGGDRVVLHSFITGEVKKTGEWLNVYFSFVPRLAEFSYEGIVSGDVDHYEIELDNNAKSSAGADYAIDDIRAYVEPPMVDALQVRPTCEGEATRIRMSSPFETLLEIAGSSEALGTDEERNLAIYYTFIDKSLYETKVRDFQNVDKLGLAEARFRAFKESVVKFDYNRGEDEDRLYGKVNFKNKYLSNFPFPENMNIDDEGATETELNPFGVGFYRTNPKTGERLLIFESDVTSGKFNEGNQYYVLLKTSDDDVSPDSYGESSADTDKNVWDFFDMYSKCANKNEISIKSAVIVRLNGIVVAEKEKLVVCENQRPVIQVNVWGQKDSDDLLTSEKELIQVTEIVPFDWFRGTVEQFKRITEKDMRPDDGNEEHTLEYALQVFRREDKYPEAESVDGIKPDADDAVSEDPDETPQEKLEQWMLDLIGWVSSPSVEYPTPRLVLCKESYTVPAVSLEGGEPEDVHVAVIPITCTHAFDNYIVCPNPKDITVTVGYKAPKLRHGLTYLGYPVNMDDVPLRIGLDQLRRDDESSSDTEFTMKQIAIPVRQAIPSEPSVKQLVLVENTKNLESVSGKKPAARQEGCIVLLETNDPEYSALGSEDSEEVLDKPLLWIGDVTKLIANTYENANMEENLFTVKLDKDFQFKEGYYYTMRFDYADEGASVFDPMDGSDSKSEVCQGQDAFTIKIVPKYLLWNGGVTDKTNLNWNNDNNWTRLDQDEIYSTKKGNEHRHYVTDGVNNNTSAYAPLDFTYVVVKDMDNVEAPYLYAPSLTKKGPAADRNRYDWPETPSEKDSHKTYNDYPAYEKGVGTATPLIQYDMAAYDYGTPKGPDDPDTGCRPWYANTCNEIHFKPGGTIMNQHELIYNRAWVDVELDPSRWYTLSLPLKEVFAGDFYLPTAGARQVTELYNPISFDTYVNNRFKPAVFQRGWDKSTAKVYELEKQGLDNFRNVAIRTFWSHVYNDVTEQYGSGVGFSVKTDVSRLSGSQWTSGNRVMFRFPKADQTFLYYNKDGSQSGHSTEIGRDAENQYRLNDSHGAITAQAAENGQYFLVGNPFMTHMDIKKFLNTNKDKLEQKYWVITKSSQIAGEFRDDTFVVANPIDGEWNEDPTVIAPMQGFFVKTKTAVQGVVLSYDESMMRRYDSRSNHSGEYLTETTRGESNGMLRIVAENDGNPSSAALLGINDGSGWNVEAIDNRDIDIPSIVYTVSKGMALSINSVKEAEGTEIGVIADDDTETVLRFEGVEAVEGLYILDKADRSLTPLEEGMELTVNGAAAGRFFLTYGLADEGVMSGIEWSVSGGVLTAVDNAASGSLEVNVYNTVGHLVKRDSTCDGIISVPLNSGIYVVEIRTAKECKSIKIRI